MNPFSKHYPVHALLFLLLSLPFVPVFEGDLHVFYAVIREWQIFNFPASPFPLFPPFIFSPLSFPSLASLSVFRFGIFIFV